MLEEEKLKMKH